MRHPAVADVAVFGVPDDYWGEAIVRPSRCARGSTRRRTSSSPSAGRLSRFKLPKAIDFLERLPRNAAGKILRRELRAPFWAGHETQVS